MILGTFEKIGIGKTSKIYSLRNPLTGDIFWVGQTILPLLQRLDGHIHECKSDSKSLKRDVIRSILTKGRYPIIEEIESIYCGSIEDKAYINDVEMYWVWQFKQWGFPMVNVIGFGYKYANKEKRYLTNLSSTK